MMLACSIFFLCSCAASQKPGEQKSSALDSHRPGQKQKTSIADLKQLYEGSKSEYERRAVCLRAIDEGAIHEGSSVSIIDERFGTDFASKLPVGNEAIKHGRILFADQPPPEERPEGQVGQAVGYIGWYMGLEYDRSGNVLNYRITNVHKGPGVSPPERKAEELAAELKKLYDTADSEHARRAVGLRAIDEGVIRSGGPISMIDAVFGTRLASALPKRKEETQSASVEFATAAPGGDKPVSAASVGWFFLVEYDADGYVYNYYLANLRK